MSLFFSFRQLWQWLRRRRRVRSIRHIRSMDAVPDDLGADLYVVGTSTSKWVVLGCTCRCGARIDVNLMKSRKPFWKFTELDGSVSLHPSLWRPAGTCGSHFFVKRSRILWV